MPRARRIVLAVFALGASLSRGASPVACGDAGFLARAKPGRAREALACYRQAHRAAPENNEVAWKLAMAAQFVGFRLSHDEDEKLALFAEGRDAASEAAKRDGNCGPCHFWAGINRALYGDAAGIFRMFATIGVVKEGLKRAAEIDPTYAHGGPDRVLGVLEQKVPGILGGSNRRAAEHFERAIQAVPTNPLNYLFLAKLQRDDLEDVAGLQTTLRRAKERVIEPPPDDVESYEAWAELKKWMTPQLASEAVTQAPQAVER
jgi:hypothetical protein